MAEGVLRGWWMLAMLVPTYFMSFLNPFYEGVLTLVPALGTLALVVGLVACFRTGPRPLAPYGALVVPSVLLIFVAGFLWEKVGDDRTVNIIASGFLGFEVLAALILLWRLRTAWLAAVPLAIFAVTFASYAMFFAAMAMTGNWL
jgi:hypothetical protein